MSKLTAIFVTLTMFSTLAFADSKAQLARFDVWLKTIEKQMNSSTNPSLVAEELLKGDSRIPAFNLQALGKIYAEQDQNKDFDKKIRKPFKALEDGIGKFDKWNKIAKKSGLEDDKNKAQEAKKELAQFLSAEEWVTAEGSKKIQSIRKFLNNYPWLSFEEDRKVVLSSLADQLEKLGSRQFDLSRLEKDGPGEDGRGLHELRREIRWFLIETRVLNGAVQLATTNTCGVPEWKILPTSAIAKEKYSELPGSATEPKACRIESCLFLGLVKNVAVLGDIKDAAEQNKEMRESDTVKGSLLSQANTVKEELRRTDVFSKLQTQIENCR